MKTALALVTFVSVILAACLPLTDQADGSSCSDDDECKSKRCHEGFCSGSTCKPSDASGCDDGWKCTHNDPDPITGFFGNDGSDTCKPTCGHCPGNSFCAADAPPGSICQLGKAPLALSVLVDNAVVGREAKLTASASNGASLTECKWELGDGRPSETTAGPTISRTFTEPGKRRMTVSCKDASGARGFLETSYEITCTPSGESCAPGACCADASMRCVGGTCRVPSPPNVEITGPLTIPLREVGTYSVSLSGGDGQAEDATWKFSDTFVTEQGLTIQHDFDEAGPNEVTVTVRTDIATQVAKKIAVNVCQTQGGRCESGKVECCAPLHCQANAIPTCQP